MLHKPLLLAIDAHGLDAWQMHDHRLIRCARFGAGEHAALAAWLAGRSAAEPCRIVVNLADETYEIEDLPRLRGSDRKALLARRRTACFPHPEFALSWSLGPPPDGRAGAERIVFGGLERADALLPWLEVVRASRLRVTRLVPAANLLPLLLNPPIAASRAPSGPQLVAGFSRAGLRISLVDGHRLLFSRLVEHCTPAAARQSLIWLDEIERTRTYLLAQRRVSAETALQVIVLERAEALHPPRAEDFPRIVFAPAVTAGSTAATRPDGSDQEPTPFEAQLLHALQRAPADLGWSLDTTRARSTLRARLQASPRTLAVASLVAAGTIGAGIWHGEQAAAAAEAAARSARAQATRSALQPPAIEPAPPVTHVEHTSPAPAPAEVPTLTPMALAPCALAEAAPAPPQPTPRRIDGILLRPDGEALVWLDGTLSTAREAGLRRAQSHAPTLSPLRGGRTALRTGDTWAPLPPATRSAASTQPTERGAHEGEPAEPPAAEPLG